jgi:hypothetical protein
VIADTGQTDGAKNQGVVKYVIKNDPGRAPDLADNFLKDGRRKDAE